MEAGELSDGVSLLLRAAAACGGGGGGSAASGAEWREWLGLAGKALMVLPGRQAEAALAYLQVRFHSDGCLFV
jgi:hypothetical protein